MATAPANDIAEPVVAGEIIILDPRQIAIGERLRPIDPVWAQALGAAMVRDGQIYPIDVCRDATGGWVLAGPGGHRLSGAIAVGMDGIEARVVSASVVSRKRREAAENVFRRDNNPMERAAAIAELVRLHKIKAGIDPAKDGRAASIAARWQKQVRDEAADTNDTMSFVYGWSQDIADQLGMNKRSIERDLMLYRRLVPSQVERLRQARHPALGNATQLRALAKLEAYHQERVVELLVMPGASLNYDQPKTIADAIKHQLGPKPAVRIDADNKRLSTFTSTFARMGLAEKKGALAWLAGQLPAGFTLTEGNAKLTASEFSSDHARYRDEALTALDEALEFIDGVLEDDVVPGERGEELERHRGQLHLTRFTIAGNGFSMEQGA